MPDGIAGALLHDDAGNALPPAPGEFLRWFAEGESERAAESFAPEAIYAAPPTEVDEAAPRTIHTGPEIAAALAADPHLGRRHPVRLCCAEDGDCLVEGWILDRSGERLRSFAASLQLDGSGLIARCL